MKLRQIFVRPRPSADEGKRLLDPIGAGHEVVSILSLMNFVIGTCWTRTVCAKAIQKHELPAVGHLLVGLPEEVSPGQPYYWGFLRIG